MSDVDDLFEDELDDEQQQQQQQPGSPEEQQQQVDVGDGGFDELEDDMADEPVAAAADGDGLGEADLFGSEEDEEATGTAAADEPLGEPISVSAPLLQRPANGQLLLMKVPNIIKVDPQPYDPNTTEVEPELMVEGGKRRLRPNDINVVRWRYRQNEDGTLLRESNARYVQWSDGSESIMLGDELLMMDRKQQPRANTYVHVVRYDAIQGLSHIKQTAHLKPASLDSKLHQRLKMTVQKATQKADKVQMHQAARNPEQEKLEAEKRAEEMARLRRSQARVTERIRAPKQRVPAFNAAYIEEEDEQEEAYFGSGRDAGGDEDDYYRRPQDDDEGAARLQSAKRSTPPPAALRSAKQPRMEQRQQDMDVDGEDLEEERVPAAAAKAAPGLKVRRGAILDDEDDD